MPLKVNMASSKARKATSELNIKGKEGKKLAISDNSSERPPKRARLLDESSSENSDSEGTQSSSSNENLKNGTALKVNEAYARRFEHNKKREELHRLQEKYGREKAERIVSQNGDVEDESSDSESEDEDEGGLLLDGNLDQEILTTLKAIREKRPEIYDKSVKFYSAIEENGTGKEDVTAKEKPMYLRDYHRKNLLEENTAESEEAIPAPPKSYMQEQEEIKETLVQELNAAEADGSDSDEDGFLIRKEKPQVKGNDKENAVIITEHDVKAADKDPETFLSNFMASRSWALESESRFQPFESDDDEEDTRAEAFEAAYNLRFETAEGANETLVAHDRLTAAKYSVRREEKTSRQKAREAKKAQKEEEKLERREEKARLRKLKIEEMEEKVKRIREAAGLSGKTFAMEDWADVLEADWDDDRWEQEMTNRFGDAYYDAQDAIGSEDEDTSTSNKKRKIKKPKWDDDIDIKDLVPDFSDEDTQKPNLGLSSGEEDAEEPNSTLSDKKQRLKDKTEKKRNARRDRRLIEQLVDQTLDSDIPLPSSSVGKNSSKVPTRFRYRETSPTSFGLTSRDILLASDTQLNQFAGLKKLAAFRDPEKKRKDKKHLGKKARLRMWRKDTFGDEDGPKGGFDTASGPSHATEDTNDVNNDDGVDIKEGKRKKKRSKKRKASAIEA